MAHFPMILLRFLYAVVIIFQCTLAIKDINIYPKYYFEDFCTDNENITYELSQTGRYSVAKIGAVHPTNVHFGGRNCTIVVKPPHGYSVYLKIKSFYFAFPYDESSDCTSYIQVFANGTMSDKLCGSLAALPSTSFTTNGNMNILLHTENNFLSRLGFALIVTAYKTSPCISNEYFLCGNSRCIWQGLICDSIDNCGDSSDEMDFGTSQCQLLAIINGGTNLSEVEKIESSKDFLLRTDISRKEKYLAEARNRSKILRDRLFNFKDRKHLQNVDVDPFTIQPIDFNFEITYPTSDIVSFRSSHNISLGAAVASAIFVILGAFIRFYCYYHCNQARRRQVLSAVTIIRTRSVLRQPSMNNAAPPPYETLVNDPEVHPENPPDYTAVSTPPPTQSTDTPNHSDANKNANVSCGPPPPYEP